MANPTKFNPGYSYTDYQNQQPTKPLPGPQVDNDFANLKQTTDQTIDALKQVRNSDGSLAHGTVGPEQIKSGDFGSVFDAAAAAAASAAAAEAWASAASASGWWSNDVTALKADMLFTYALGTLRTVAANDYIQTRREGFVYQVLAAASGGAHIITAGGVKLSVRPSANGWNLRAFGAVGDGVTDDTTAWGFFQAAVGHVKFTPAGSYLVSGTAKVYATGVVGNGVFDDTPAAPSVSFNGDLDTGVYSGGANLIGFSAGGTRRALLGTTTFQIDVQIAGTAVQSSATDTTAGRLLPVGAFGLGENGTPPLLTDLDDTTTPTGFWYTSAATTGAFPVTAGFASVVIEHVGAGWVKQTLSYRGDQVAANMNTREYWRMAIWSGPIVWGPWRQNISIPVVTPTNGSMLVMSGDEWTPLAGGADGKVLRSAGPTLAPVWDDVAPATPTQATTAGTQFDFTGVPAWVRKITVLVNAVSLTAGDLPIIQLGTIGGFVVTGYLSSIGSISSGGSASRMTSTAGFVVGNTAASEAGTVVLELYLVGATNTWIASVSGARSTGEAFAGGGGSLALGAALTQVRLTRTGASTFDGGSVSLIWE